MRRSWQPAGLTFTLRLLALLLIPLVGLGVLSIQHIEIENDRSATERQLVDEAQLQEAIAAVYGPAQLEQIALEGLAVIDSFGVPRELVVSVAGVDFEAIYEPNVVALDTALDELIADHGDAPVGDNSTLGTELNRLRGSLAAQRQLTVDGRTVQSDVAQIFAQLDELLASAIRNERTALASQIPGGSAEHREQLTALSDVLTAAGERGKALLGGLLDRRPETVEEIRRASNRLDFTIERYTGLLDDAQAEELEQVVAELDPVPLSLLVGIPAESIATAFDPDYITTSVTALLGQLAFLEVLENYSSDFHSTAVSQLEASADKASRAAATTRNFAASIVVISLVILALLAWSTLRPLRRLTRRAADISGGLFDVEPLPERGPRDVRVLTNTMNSMATTLRAVDHEISHLASGAPGSDDRVLPGAIGVSIAQSFDRLEATTDRLHASQQLASAIVEQAADAIWTIDERGIITSANSASVDLIGVPAHVQLGQPLTSYLPDTDGEVTLRSGTSETARLLVASNEIIGGDQTLTTVIARDISVRMRFEERLAYQAHHDGLTGLPNRVAVLEALANAPAGASLTVLFIDLDGFKSVNDTQGHLAGDRVLTEVGRRLSAQVRQGDFVGRLGGDEFVVVMNDLADVNDAVAFAYRLIREIEQPYHDEEHLFALSACVGVATFEAGLEAAASSPLDAIQAADSAVYAAKRRGRGRVEAFDEQLQARIVNDAEVELALRDAVRNNELELHLQPVLDTVLGRFSSAEALVRWNRPGIGMVPPDAFIPIAERSSLINEIDRWVLATACETLARWADIEELSDLRIAVNIAGSHLLDGDLIADLHAAIELTGANPQLLEFELTETQLMDDHQRAATILQQVRAKGIRVAIDDFGTGYSSMAYLRELPIDTLKIDRSFISPIGADASDTTVVDALLTIGHALGLSVVAEGIESAKQLEYATNHGADRAQGFHLARPMPIADAEAILVVAPAHPTPTS